MPTGMRNAYCTMLYDVMRIVHGLYAKRCPLGSCIMDFKGTSLGLLSLCKCPLNSMKPPKEHYNVNGG